MFGIGGAEWLIILGIVFMLFVPGAVMFAIGFFMGKKAGVVKRAVLPDEPGLGSRDE